MLRARADRAEEKAKEMISESGCIDTFCNKCSNLTQFDGDMCKKRGTMKKQWYLFVACTMTSCCATRLSTGPATMSVRTATGRGAMTILGGYRRFYAARSLNWDELEPPSPAQISERKMPR